MSRPAAAFRLDALVDLAQEPCGDRRRALLREATEVFFAPRPPPPELLDLFATAVAKLADVVEVEVRAELADRLAHTPAIPHRLLKRLISDEDDRVATPVLAYSDNLTPEDLLETASTGGQPRLRAVSARPDLTEAVSDKVVERGDVTTLGVLIANARAPLSRAACEALVDRAAAHPGLHEALVDRDGLPLDLLNSMYVVVEKRLRARILERNIAVPEEVFQDTMDQVCVRVAVQHGSLPDDWLESKQYVDRLQSAGPVSPATLLRFAKEGLLTRLILAVGNASGVDELALLSLLRRKDADAFSLTCRAAGYTDDVFAMLLRTLMPDADLDARIAAFHQVPRGIASRVVSFWRLRREAEGD